MTKRVLISALASLSLMACSSDSDLVDSETPQTVAEQSDEPSATPQSSESEVPGEARSTAIGDVLVFGANERTLYTFANDDEGVSNCSGGCAETWPPILANAEQSSGAFRTIERDDSSLQWAYKDSPLYYYAGDATVGEINGEGLGGVWYVARPDPYATGETTLGTVLTGKGSINAGLGDATQRTDLDGRTLYVFTNDSADTSNCSGACARTWPPLYADLGAASDGDYTVISRDDGTSQWAYKSQPLYFYVGDNAAGDTTGEGVNGVWYVATP